MSARYIICNTQSVGIHICLGEEIAHRPNLYFAVDGNGLVLDSVQTKHGGLGEVDDRGAHKRAKDATLANISFDRRAIYRNETYVADSESSASHILNGQLIVPSLLAVSASTETSPWKIKPSCPSQR